MSIFKKIFKTYSEKEVKRIKWMVDKINEMESEIEKLTDKELANKTNEFKERLANGETLDDILIPAFAVCREASKRVLGMRHFDVQLIGGIILHQGRIAEMKTGEGKTLVATLPVYLNALTGKGVHVITVNDYLAKRDSEWMGKLYNFLGISVGLVISGMDKEEKQQAYQADITYGTNNEYGFDYLRDNMVINKKDMVQRELNYAIVDEIDSILIDEARTPLIISGQGEKSSELYKVADSFAKSLKAKKIVESNDKEIESEEDKEYDYIIDLKAKSAALTESGIKRAERYFNVADISDVENTTLLHHINQALKANGIMKRDIDYVVKDGEVLIVDEFTGRIMIGRRYNEGLHQAIEAKENVKIANESKTLATITFQNYFRLYNKLAGMTGTAMTEEKEFRYTYNLDVVSIPTNKPIARKDLNDQVYKTEKGKLMSIVNEVKKSNEKGQPVLVGTVTIEKSEELSKLLKREGIKHEVLNAKYHEKEAEIIAQAGKYGSVTIATNMAGRGTDIMLGGNSEYLAKIDMKKQGYEAEIIEAATAYNETDNEEILSARKEFRRLKNKYEEEIADERQKVINAGGLKIIGTERHESRRIDNQLRGRSGRQGDPGETRFFISLEDDMMKLFGSQGMTAIFNAMQIPEDMPIEHRLLSNTIETAQKTIEGRHFSMRKNVLRFDDVMNEQRKIMYSQRRTVLDGEDVKEKILKMRDSLIEEYVNMYCYDVKENWNMELLKAKFINLLNEDIESYNLDVNNKDELVVKIKEIANNKYAEKEELIGESQMRHIERYILLQVVDDKWMAHIDDMDQLKNGIGLRGYAQRDPIYEYAQEGSEMFEAMNNAIKEDTVALIYKFKLQNDIPVKPKIVITKTSGGDNTITKEPIKKKKEVGRNDPCPCGSGKKYKNCCGK